MTSTNPTYHRKSPDRDCANFPNAPGQTSVDKRCPPCYKRVRLSYSEVIGTAVNVLAVSSKEQIVLPAAMRRALSIGSGEQARRLRFGRFHPAQAHQTPDRRRVHRLAGRSARLGRTGRAHRRRRQRRRQGSARREAGCRQSMRIALNTNVAISDTFFRCNPVKGKPD